MAGVSVHNSYKHLPFQFLTAVLLVPVLAFQLCILIYFGQELTVVLRINHVPCGLFLPLAKRGDNSCCKTWQQGQINGPQLYGHYVSHRLLGNESKLTEQF